MPAGLVRRLAAILYDSVLLVALWLVTTAAFLPFTGGEALTARETPLLEIPYRLALVAVLIGFYGTSWTRSGQTLGMAAWRLRVEREDGTLLDWRDTVRRLAAAALSWLALGAGWLVMLRDPQQRAWHDRVTRTRVVVLPR